MQTNIRRDFEFGLEFGFDSLLSKATWMQVYLYPVQVWVHIIFMGNSRRHSSMTFPTGIVQPDHG
jgi:hypothetical protein